MKKPKRSLVTVKLGLAQMPAETFTRLVSLAEDCQDAFNACWALWYRQAVEDELFENFRETLAASQAAKTNAAIEPPKKEDWPKPGRKSLSMDCSRAICERVPRLHSRCRTLIVNEFMQKLYSQPSGVVRKLKLWQAICLGKEQIPTARSRMPLPFDRQNATLVMVDDKPHLKLRLARVEMEGRSRAISQNDEITIELRRKQRPKESGEVRDKFADLVREAAEGGRKWCGSQLTWHRKKRKWLVDLVIEADPLPPIQGSATARLFSPEAGSAAWKLEVNGRTHSIGRTRQVEYTRRTIRGMKADARAIEGYGSAKAGRGSNGHGRAKSIRLFTRITGRWDGITRSFNSQVVASVLVYAARYGIEVLKYERPGAKSVLESAGYVIGETPDWPMFDFEEKLKRKLSARGVSVVFLGVNESQTEEVEKVAANVLESTAE